MKVLIFHTALAPYRVDFFNKLGESVDLRIVFLTRNNANQAFDQSQLLKEATYTYGYLDNHYTLSGRNINFGYSKEIEKFNPDIVICNEFAQSTISCFCHKIVKNQKYKIFTICDDSEDVFENRKGLRKFLSHFFATHLDGMICINPIVANKYRHLGARNVSLFPIIYHESSYRHKLSKALTYTDTYIDRFELAGYKCLIFVGRLTAVKNLRNLLKCFSIVNSDISEKLKLILVGDGDLRLTLQQDCNDLGISDSVIFAGRYEDNELYAWYNLNGIFILPSIYEPFGAVVGEALMAGMPAIVSDKVGAKCLIDGSNGLVFDSSSINDMAIAVKTMLNRNAIVRHKSSVRSSILPYHFDSLMNNLLYDFESC